MKTPTTTKTRRPKKDARSRTRTELAKLRAAVPVLEAEVKRLAEQLKASEKLVVERDATLATLRRGYESLARERDASLLKLDHLRSMGVNVDNYGS